MNNQIFYFFYNFTHQSKAFDQIIIFLAVYFPYIVVILAGLFLLFHHDIFKAENPYQVFLEKKKEILMVFVSCFSGYLLALALKLFFHASRPFLSLPDIEPLFIKTTYSFPSEHATFFMALAISIYFLHKKAGYWFIFFALTIGIARIVAGVHFPLDILGGFALGGMVSYLATYFLKNL